MDGPKPGEEGSEYQPMTLANVNQGELEESFEACCQEVIEIFNEPGFYMESSGDRLRAVAKIEVVFELDLKTGLRTVTSGCNLARPKRKTETEAAYVKAGQFLVQPNLKQHNLYSLPNRDAGTKEG